MNEQDGRCTAAYESEVFPYFTCNVYKDDLTAGNHGGVFAFFERMRIAKANRLLFDLLGVYVDGDCELHCGDGDSIEFLLDWHRLTIEGELLPRGCPTKQRWELAPLRFLTDWS